MVNKITVNNQDSNYTHSIFDISEYTGISYDTLSDALDDIPQAKHKGGMTVRYIDSNDKYVQYRLMSDTFNTTPANWQGVDEEPTAGSNNLVKSGSIVAFGGGLVISPSTINVFKQISEIRQSERIWGSSNLHITINGSGLYEIESLLDIPYLRAYASASAPQSDTPIATYYPYKYNGKHYVYVS